MKLLSIKNGLSRRDSHIKRRSVNRCRGQGGENIQRENTHT